jgi:hypothetical protein
VAGGRDDGDRDALAVVGVFLDAKAKTWRRRGRGGKGKQPYKDWPSINVDILTFLFHENA